MSTLKNCRNTADEKLPSLLASVKNLDFCFFFRKAELLSEYFQIMTSLDYNYYQLSNQFKVLDDLTDITADVSGFVSPCSLVIYHELITTLIAFLDSRCTRRFDINSCVNIYFNKVFRIYRFGSSDSCENTLCG